MFGTVDQWETTVFGDTTAASRRREFQRLEISREFYLIIMFGNNKDLTREMKKKIIINK